MRVEVALWRIRRWIGRRPFVAAAQERRYEQFRSRLGVRPADRILDVGSGANVISGTLGRLNRENPITALDLLPRRSADAGNVVFVQGDARAMPFADGEFEVAFCNSLIEHLAPEDRVLVAREIRRVASGYWVQTPNRHFPIEPHQMIPGFQYLPSGLRRRLDRKLTGGAYTELLTERELRALFPDAALYKERALGLTKSFAAYRAVARPPR